jgi:hypothetical protein
MQSTYEWASISVQVGILALLGYVAWRLGQIDAKTGISFYSESPAHFHRRPFNAGHHRILDEQTERSPAHFHRRPFNAGHHRILDEETDFGIAYSIWAYRGGDWALLKRCGQIGCTCGPPADPADYEGKVVRKECPAN